MQNKCWDESCAENAKERREKSHKRQHYSNQNRVIGLLYLKGEWGVFEPLPKRPQE